MKKNKKKNTKADIYKSIGVDFSHFLRGGAGAHQDRKKEDNKRQCRKKIDY
jgi:hypothetical protein